MLGSLEPALQVDLVWALCVLQQVREAELRAVLHPGLHTRFLGEASSYTRCKHVLYCNMEAPWSASRGGNWSRDRKRPEHTKHNLGTFSRHSLQLAYDPSFGTPA